MPDESERIERLAAEGRISEADAVRLHEALAAAEQRGASRGIGILSWALAIIDAALSMLLALGVPPTVNRFKNMFREMQLKEGLPALTELFLAVPGGIYALGFGTLAALLIGKEFFLRNKKLTLGINVVVGIGLLAFGLLYILGLYLPMVSMMRQLSAPAGG